MVWGMIWHHLRKHYHKWMLLIKHLFCFMQHGRLPSEWSLSPGHRQSSPAHENWMCYCVQVRVTSGEGGGDQPHLPDAWAGLLIADTLQDVLEEWIVAVVLVPREAILILVSDHWGLPHGDTRDVGFHLVGQVKWAGRETQVEMMVSTVQEGCWAIMDVVMEKRTKARGTSEMMKWVIVGLNRRMLILSI